MSELDVDVHVVIPREQFLHLLRLADKHNTTVGSLVREAVRRQVGDVPPIVPSEGAMRARRKPKDPLSSQGLSDAQEERLIALHAEGLTDAAIGERLGKSFWTIYYHGKRLGLPATRGRRQS